MTDTHTTSRPEIEHLLSLAENATPGEWLLDLNGYGVSVNTDIYVGENWPVCTTRLGSGEPDERRADAAFVAASRSAVPQLARYALELEERIAALEGAKVPANTWERDVYRQMASRLEGLHAQMFGIMSMNDPEAALQALQDGGSLQEAVHDCLRALPPATAKML